MIAAVGLALVVFAAWTAFDTVPRDSVAPVESVRQVDTALSESNLLRDVLALQLRLSEEAHEVEEENDVRLELTHHRADG